MILTTQLLEHTQSIQKNGYISFCKWSKPKSKLSSNYNLFKGAKHNLLWRKWWDSNPTAHDGLQGEIIIFFIFMKIIIFFREWRINSGTHCSNNQTFAPSQNTQLFSTRTPLPILGFVYFLEWDRTYSLEALFPLFYFKISVNQSDI